MAQCGWKTMTQINSLTIVSRSAKVAALIDALNELALTDKPEVKCEILVTVLCSCVGLEPLIYLTRRTAYEKSTSGTVTVR
jgi:hypothetical protein